MSRDSNHLECMLSHFSVGAPSSLAETKENEVHLHCILAIFVILVVSFSTRLAEQFYMTEQFYAGYVNYDDLCRAGVF